MRMVTDWWYIGALSLMLAGTAGAADAPVADAVKSQNPAGARALLKQGADVNLTQRDGATALHWAAQWNDLESAELLLRAGARVNVGNDYGATPLWLAAQNGSVQFVDRLLAAGADPNIGLPSGETPLMTAARTGVAAVVRALVRKSASVDVKEGFRGQTALMWSLAENHLDVARALVEAGANVSARSSAGFTPLMFAAREGRIDAARFLLDKGADINAAASDGSTPLIIATVRGHADFAMFLLDNGADPNLATPGYTALHWAVGRWETLFTWDYPRIVTGEWGHFLGLREGRVELINALLAHGADVNARTRRPPPRFGSGGSGQFPGGQLVGATPFYIAANVGETDIMRLLLAAGADHTIPNADRTTALIAAAGATRRDDTSRIPESNFLEATELCLSLGLDVNAKNVEGIAPMHAAAVAGFDSVVQYLFDHGGELSPRTSTGQTPLAYAISFEVAMTTFEHPSTAALLRTLGAKE